MKIKPIKEPGKSLSYHIDSTIPPEQISKVLGFKPNVQDDPDRVTHSWGFQIGKTRCGIWDYKGQRWSVYDPTGHLVRELFES